MRYKIIKVFPFFDQRISFIKRLPFNGGLLDIGCGTGYVLRRFQQVRPDIKIVGIDKENSCLMLGNISFYQLDIERSPLPFSDNYFDGISIIHVIEHLKSAEVVLKESFRVLKGGGYFYIETPHIKSLSLPSLNFFSKEGQPLNFYDDPTHVRCYSKESLRKMLEILATDVKFGSYRNYLYALISPLLIIFGFILLKRRWVVGVILHLFGWSMFCTGRKDIGSSGKY